MSRLHLLPFLIPLAVLAACGTEQSPTAPSAVRDPSFSTPAATRVVNSAADPGNGVCNASQCTLREAINDAGSTNITFAAGLTGPITLAKPSDGGGQLVINKTLAITGPSGGMVVRRRSTDPEFRILRIGTSGNVSLTNLTIRNGKIDGGGGGILSFGPLTLTSSTVSGNSADFGGGIDNHARLTIVHSTIATNTGGGIYNHNNQTLAITTTTVGQNTGRGLVNDGGTLTLTSSTVAENAGGGISQARGTSTLSLARVVDNSTAGRGGGIFLFQGDMTIRTSTIARNSAETGGGIANRDGSTMRILRSTIFDNTATDAGGGIANEARGFGRLEVDLRLTNSTVSGNSAPIGGGIFNSNFIDEAEATLEVTNSTVANNSATQDGGGIDVNAGFLALVNSLVAGNDAPTGPDVLEGPEGAGVGASFSLIGDGSGSGITNTNGNHVGTSGSPIDPKIGPLANNGGPTRTHALLAGSPAIDAASSADCPAVDQRGVVRPQGAGCDIGSYER
jgi:CSLREA domain-containing protein